MDQLLAEFGMTDEEAAEHERLYGPWRCDACGYRNEAETDVCRYCLVDRP